MRKVAFDVLTETLLLLVRAAHEWQLVSLHHNWNGWVEGRHNTSIPNDSVAVEMALCDSRVLIGRRAGNVVYVFDVTASHTLRAAGNVTLNSGLWGLACARRDNDTLVGITFAHLSEVTLHRLASDPLRFEPLATRGDLIAPRWLLFREDLLLVADWNNSVGTHAILSFRASGNALTERRVLLDAKRSVLVGAWTLVGDRLTVSELNSTGWTAGDLHIYDFA